MQNKLTKSLTNVPKTIFLAYTSLLMQKVKQMVLYPPNIIQMLCDMHESYKIQCKVNEEYQ